MENQDAASFSSRKQLKLTLHPGDEYVDSLEPESLQVLTYVKLASCSCQVSIDLSCFSNTPSLSQEQCPPIRRPQHIISHLKELGDDNTKHPLLPELYSHREILDQGHDIDSHLTLNQRSEILAYNDLLTDRLLPAILYMQWLDTQHYLSVTRWSYGRLLTFPLSFFYISFRRKSVLHFLMREASPECTLEDRKMELLERANECLNLLSAKLGEGPYFYGSKPSSLDALVFGYLEVIGQCSLQGSDDLLSKLQACQNLLSFCQRTRKDCFPLAKDRVSTSPQSTANKVPAAGNMWKEPAFWASVGVALLVLGIQGRRVGLFS